MRQRAMIVMALASNPKALNKDLKPTIGTDVLKGKSRVLKLIVSSCNAELSSAFILITHRPERPTMVESRLLPWPLEGLLRVLVEKS